MKKTIVIKVHPIGRPKRFSVTYIDNLPTNKIYIHGMDGSTHLLSEFVVVNEPTSGATPGESRKFDAPITKDKKLTDEHCGRLVRSKKAVPTKSLDAHSPS